MDKKVRERRRAISRERGRRRAGWFAVILLLVIGLGAFLWLRSSDVFAVTKITSTAVEHVAEEAVAEATADVRGANLLKLRLGDIEERLLELPYVRSATLHRVFPNTLEIVLQEYEAVACVQTNDGSRWLVSEDGRVLEKRLDGTLPLIVSESRSDMKLGGVVSEIVVKALAIADALRDPEVVDLLPEVEKVAVSSSGDLTLWLAGPVELRLGQPNELKQKLKVSGVIVQQYLRDGRPIEYVDARVPDSVAVKEK